MAKVNIGQTTLSLASQFGYQRKIIKTSDGNLFLFANLGGTTDTRLRYKKSTDNGVTWGDWVLVYNTANIAEFDIYNDNNDLYLIFNALSNIRFLKLTYSGGSYSVGSLKTVAAVNYYSGSITKKSDGNLWVATYSTDDLYTYYSSDGGDTWNSGGNILNVGGNVMGVKIIPIGNNLWVLFLGGTYLNYVEYTTSWGIPVTIAGANSVQSLGNRFSATEISDADIWIAATKYNVTAANRVIKVWHYTGSWDSGTEISNSGTNEDIEPTISIVGNKPVVVWNENAKANINYRKWNGVSWDAIQTLDSTNVFLPTACEKDNEWLYVYWLSGSASPYTIYFDKVNLNPTKTKDLTSSMHIKALGIVKDLTSSMEITNTKTKDLDSSMHIKAEGLTEDLSSSMKIILDRVQVDLSSSMAISQTALKDITSDMYIVTPYFKNIANKITFTKGARYDIGNKINFAKRILANIFNIITFVKGIILDINNDIRFQKRKLYNVRNDIRFCKSWQKAGAFGFQSLGKEYIKVYISNVLQTDVDVNSIRFNKQPNQAQTASFDLGRAYDTSKPAQEAIVQIKYGDETKSIPEQLLYKGYIVSISPADNPESITINCQDRFWLDNRTNKYFKVGQKPPDDPEKYYSTIKSALSSEYSWNLDLGTFVPEEIDCFSVGSSDILVKLITEAGNYGFFYDENWNKKLWIADRGAIVNIQRQTLGKNLKLYDLIEHRFDEDVTGIVNKYRVQMGNRVTKDADKKIYIASGSSYYRTWLGEGWEGKYEDLARDSDDGYGWDNPKLGEEAEYSKVYKYYRMIEPSIPTGADRHPPLITVRAPGWFYGGILGRITEGFTIDYEKGLVIFSERVMLRRPTYIWGFGGLGTYRYIYRAPNMELELFKEVTYTTISVPAQDPENDIGNPLQFFTDRMGDYRVNGVPVTIIDDLNLTNLNIQKGSTYYDVYGKKIIVPSWDDTAFAKDKANWELSKVCDKKIRGTIELTLDATCFYGIDLDKRIYIEGITESPMNIVSMDYDMGRFIVRITLENNRFYKRSVSLPYRGV